MKHAASVTADSFMGASGLGRPYFESKLVHFRKCRLSVTLTPAKISICAAVDTVGHLNLFEALFVETSGEVPLFNAFRNKTSG